MRHKTIALQMVAGTAVTALIVALLPWSEGNVIAGVWTALRMRTLPAYTIDQVERKLVKRESGCVDAMLLSGDTLALAGWAADIIAKQPARSVQFFVGQKNIGVFVPDRGRPDVAAALRFPTSQPFGFVAGVPATSTSGVRAFAEMRDGSFAELHYPVPAKR